jgi:hypothetical protein
MTATARNVLIILLLAAGVAFLPGGGSGAAIATQTLSLAFLGALGYFASIMYRQHRVTLYALGDARRAIVYVALGVVLLTVTATSRLWSTSGGIVVWFVLVGSATYAVIAIVVAARRY